MHLWTTTVKLNTMHLSQLEPLLRRKVMTYMLNASSHSFIMRKVCTNWFRIFNVIAAVINVVKLVDDTRAYKKTTILIHALLVLLVWFPNLIIPTFTFYAFMIKAWNY